MDARSPLFVATFVFWTLSLPAFAVFSGLADANGECPFSKAFLRDYDAAQKLVDELKSAEPLLKLLKKYHKVEEQAELELSIGMAYSQRTGVIDYTKAVIHLSEALKFDLPEGNRLQILVYRGESLEILKRYDAALRDYLRGLLACSYYDLSVPPNPEAKDPKSPLCSSDTPEEMDRRRDYEQYRKTLDFRWFLFLHRHSFVDAVKRVQTTAGVDETGVRKILEELTPDSSRYDVVVGFIKSDNKQPLP